MNINFDKQIYNKEALIKAAYQFTDIAYIHLRQDANEYIVEINAKDDTQTVLDKRFKNEMIAQMARQVVFERTKKVRELILSRSLASTIIDEIEVEEVEDIEETNFDIDNILNDWFDENEKN